MDMNKSVLQGYDRFKVNDWVCVMLEQRVKKGTVKFFYYFAHDESEFVCGRKVGPERVEHEEDGSGAGGLGSPVPQ
ncbi:hypothetical protein NDU88_000890 [Pleurodeles waltl]|uniref:Uncharacterized protein n=1 Tax=Pleurodeles waltl TaxID=8319 RepID=A0AAV7WK76_PLEWA|nr:hypothetical protein NDU88_000890 [Pleurodeles waltl]